MDGGSAYNPPRRGDARCGRRCTAFVTPRRPRGDSPDKLWLRAPHDQRVDRGRGRKATRTESSQPAPCEPPADRSRRDSSDSGARERDRGDKMSSRRASRCGRCDAPRPPGGTCDTTPRDAPRAGTAAATVAPRQNREGTGWPPGSTRGSAFSRVQGLSNARTRDQARLVSGGRLLSAGSSRGCRSPPSASR